MPNSADTESSAKGYSHPSPASISTLPQWKQSFLSKPSASIRKGIAWDFEQPYEDTDTLVLTSAGGRFVDVRFPKVGAPPTAFWAFTGQASTGFYEAGSGDGSLDVGLPHTAHCIYTHEVDSRGPGIKDEGDVFVLPNGEAMEMGIMHNPNTGKEQLYKELWGSAPTGSSGERVCVLAETKGDKGRGVAIRLGNYAQAIVEQSAATQTISVERWEKKSEWIRDSRSTAELPLAWLCDGQRKIGDTETSGDRVWELMEAAEF